MSSREEGALEIEVREEAGVWEEWRVATKPSEKWEFSDGERKGGRKEVERSTFHS